VVALRLEVPSNLAAVRTAAGKVREFLAGQGLTAMELDQWELAFVEAANNVAEHGNVSPESRLFQLAVDVTATNVEIRIIDHTAGFEYPDEVKLPDDSLSEGGRGLYLIESICDRVHYLRGRGTNCLILRKRRDPAGVAVAPEPDVTAMREEIAELNEALDGMTEELASSYESQPGAEQTARPRRVRPHAAGSPA
jgi:anti-sigma regulatory factor (Ser/Thr protein kinase)